MEQDKTIGAVGWMDLTVPDAEGVRSFYERVVGWGKMDISMGEYNDYCMTSPADNVVRGGICHARGANESIPPSWIMYVNVADLDASLRAVEEGGGAIVNGPRNSGKSRYSIIRDPAGAHLALFQHGE